MGQMFSHVCPFSMFRSRYSVLLLTLLTVAHAVGQKTRQTPSSDGASGTQRAIKLAQTGHCEEAVPALRKASQQVADKASKRTVGFAGVRCAMLLNQTDAAIDFLRLL